QKIDFNVAEISEEIYSYTSGYPYLVSRICKHIDEKLNKEWSVLGIEKAVKILVTEKNTLFDDLFKNLENDKSLFDLVYAILILGEERKYSIDVSTTNFGLTYGIIRNENNKIKISNKIFEIRICEFFISKDESVTKKSNVLKYDIVKNNHFDMKLCLEKFAEYYEEIYSEKELPFLEKHGRLLFLSYLRPLINSEGFFHIESQFTDLRRMDLVIDFNNQQFVIELKIWDGEIKHREAYKQLSNYLEKKNLKTGYLLTFNFNKNKEKVKKISTENYGDYEIFDVIV
ncbi:MAG: GxxExxY protein, partial [Oscillospiraceae bacterium]|nr:GxxExxY protein [Oscillospiraceae bacterium]